MRPDVGDSIAVELSIVHPDADRHFALVETERRAIHDELGYDLLWLPRGGRATRYRRVSTPRKPAYVDDHSDWPRLANPQFRRQLAQALASCIPTLGEVALDFQPGSRWAYSGGTGLDVVAPIVEIVSGMPYDEFVQKRIFDPLGMNDTHYNVPPSGAST